MPISDNDPERRNLVVSSVCFILYYLAGGTFRENIVRLQVVNVEFSRPYVLAVLAWVMLFWFAFRYWQKNRGVIGQTFHEDIKGMSRSRIIVWYISNKTGKKFRQPNGFIPDELNKDHGRLAIRYGDIVGGRYENGTLVEFQSKKYDRLSIDGFLGLFVKTILFIKISILKPGMGSFLVPYILFSLVVILGLLSGLL